MSSPREKGLKRLSRLLTGTVPVGVAVCEEVVAVVFDVVVVVVVVLALLVVVVVVVGDAVVVLVVLVVKVVVVEPPPLPPGKVPEAKNTPRPFVPTNTWPAVLPLPASLQLSIAPKP